MGRPKHVLGIPWGSDARQACTRFGLTDEEWEPWEGDGAFVTRIGRPNAVQLFGATAGVRVVAADGRFEGAQLTFDECAAHASELRAAVIAEYELEGTAEDDLYENWATGEVVRLTRNSGDDTCRLTVAGPRFGPAYARYVLQSGFASLVRGLKP